MFNVDSIFYYAVFYPAVEIVAALEEMAKDVDMHIDWIETQMETIKQVGLENYLAEQIKKDE